MLAHAHCPHTSGPCQPASSLSPVLSAACLWHGERPGSQDQVSGSAYCALAVSGLLPPCGGEGASLLLCQRGKLRLREVK